MNDSPFLAEIQSIPALVESSHDRFRKIAAEIATSLTGRGIDQVIMTGCGDSYFAGVAARLAFHHLTGLPSYALTAMELSRYQLSQIATVAARRSLVIAISNSGQVSRTVEALSLARRTGAIALAITGNKESELGALAEMVFSIRDPDADHGVPGLIIPGTRSYYLSFLALAHLAVAIGATIGQPAGSFGVDPVSELESLAPLTSKTLKKNDEKIARLAKAWQDAGRYVFCGSGPNYGTALYSAAKIIEAVGDPAIGQDLEEWAHLQYFEKEVETPTIIISSLAADVDRALEIVAAAAAIGRRVTLVAPDSPEVSQPGPLYAHLTCAGPLAEHWSPLITALPGLLLAAYLSHQKSEPSFRDFGGGRSRAGGGGISRIRDSHRLDQEE